MFNFLVVDFFVQILNLYSGNLIQQLSKKLSTKLKKKKVNFIDLIIETPFSFQNTIISLTRWINQILEIIIPFTEHQTTSNILQQI